MKSINIILSVAVVLCAIAFYVSGTAVNIEQRKILKKGNAV